MSKHSTSTSPSRSVKPQAILESHEFPVHTRSTIPVENTHLRQRPSQSGNSISSPTTHSHSLPTEEDSQNEFHESGVSTRTVPIQTHQATEAAEHTLPVHITLQSSVLSYEHSKVSYKGFLNLALLLLFVTNVRLVVENYMKYGFLISIPGQYVPPQDWVFSTLAVLLLPFNLLVIYLVERVVLVGYVIPFTKKRSLSPARNPDEPARKLDQQAKAQYKRWTVISGLAHGANLTVMLAVPCYVVYYKVYHPLLGFLVLFMVVIQTLKMISYVLTNRSLRYNLIHGLAQPTAYTIHYPHNVSLRDLLFYTLVPTLCYQPSYPRSARFRKRFFLKRCLEGTISIVMIYFLVEQYAIPTLKNSVQAWEQLNIPQILERVFKLSTTSVLIWLLGFYALFHAFLNALAELLHFGDRSFYLPWWNSGTLARYWRLWNQPVHYFFKRHVYIPCLKAGMPSFAAVILTFFLSALLHEILFGIPTHTIRGHAFWGIMFQVPLILFTERLAKYTSKDSSVGNIFFWISFCILGQPLLVVRYFYDWTQQNIMP